MAADEERLEILRMVQNGQISTDEAAELLDALEGPAHLEGHPDSPVPSSMQAKDTNSSQNGTSTNLLAKTLELAAKLARRANIGMWGLLGDVK
jgi:hypothetical protein